MDINPVVDQLLARLWAGEKRVLLEGAYDNTPDDQNRVDYTAPGFIELSARLRIIGVMHHTSTSGTWLSRIEA